MLVKKYEPKAKKMNLWLSKIISATLASSFKMKDFLS